MPLEVNLALCLPTDAMSMPVVRHICSCALREVGVVDSCLSDIGLALTETCTNVLDHVRDGGPAYEVQVGIDDRRCSIRVKDTGPGFDVETRNSKGRVEETSESGRGLELIRSLVDRVKFTAVPDEGLVVHLERDLQFDDQHPVRRRMGNIAST